MLLNMNCFCAIYVDRNQRTFLAQMTSFVVRYDVIYHSFLIILIFLYQGLAGLVILYVRKIRCYSSNEA